MADNTRSKTTDEISKLQAKFNENMGRFRSEILDEIGQMRIQHKTDSEHYQRDILRNSSNSYTDPPTMDLHPLSFVDDVASCNYSELEAETTGELHSDEELTVTELLASSEMMDFDDINDNDCSKSGLQVLSIHCTHMATKWRPVLDSQPIQENDTSVEAYYDRFFNWKRKLEEVNYNCGEESYVDDFIYGLEIKLGMRVCGYKWKPHTLYGAFRRAMIEESLMKNDAVMVFEEMPHPTSTKDQGTEDVVLDASDEGCNIVLDTSVGSAFKLMEEDNEPRQLLLQTSTGLNEGNAFDKCVVLSLNDLQASYGSLGDKTMNNSCNGSTKAWLEGASSIIKVVLGQNSRKKDAAMEIMLGEIMVFMFDPGISSLFDEMFKSFQGAEQVNDLYVRDVKLIKQALFDSGRGRNGVVCISRRDTHPLLGKSHQMFVFAFKGIIPSPRHANSFIDVVLEMMLGKMVVFDLGAIKSSLDDIDSVPVSHGLFIQKNCGLYALDDIMQASATVIGSHKRNINGDLLVMFAASSVLPSCVNWPNIDTGNPITPSVACAVVIQQLMYLMKAYNIPTAIETTGTTLVIGYGLEWRGGSWYQTSNFRKEQIRFLVQMKPRQSTLNSLALLQKFEPRRSLLIRSSLSRRKLPDFPSSSSSSAIISLSYSSQLGEQVPLYIIMSHLVLSSFYVALVMLASVIWGPGQDVIILYIIEDNDVIKRRGIRIQMAGAVKQNDVKLSMLTMQMAQMLQLVEFGSHLYDHGSYTIMASENTWHANFYPSSNVAYTNVIQRDVYGDVQNRAALETWLQIRNEDFGGCCMLDNLLGFVWDPGLQMSMEEESDNQHLGFWFGEKVPYVCSVSALMLALSPVSCDSYSMWQCHVKMTRQAARSAPKMQGQITAVAIVSIIFGISRFMSCALQPYPNALAGWLSIYIYNECAAISKMLYGIPVFVFQPP